MVNGLPTLGCGPNYPAAVSHCCSVLAKHRHSIVRDTWPCCHSTTHCSAYIPTASACSTRYHSSCMPTSQVASKNMLVANVGIALHQHMLRFFPVARLLDDRLPAAAMDSVLNESRIGPVDICSHASRVAPRRRSHLTEGIFPYDSIVNPISHRNLCLYKRQGTLFLRHQLKVQIGARQLDRRDRLP